MVKRVKQEDLAGALEFEGRTAEDPEFTAWLAEHRARKGGKIRVTQGGKGVRVLFSSAADMASWKARLETSIKEKAKAAAALR
jgi:hypothetical protein